MNPLAYPSRVSRDEHIDNVVACFRAGMPLYGPLEGLLLESIEEVYRQVPEGREFPLLEDLAQTARRIVDLKGYEGEVLGNLKAALELRIGGLTRRSVGRLFSVEHSTPTVEELLQHPTIIEMDYLSNETACLLTLFLLSSIREHIRATRPSGSELTHVTVVEEAHIIVGRSADTKTGEDAPNPRAFAAQYVSRMLAELRALGEGLIIADQLPSAVAPEVVKNTAIKVAARLVSKDDREDLGATMLLGPAQLEEMARLEVGEAYVYYEGLHLPRRIRALNTHYYLDLPKQIPLGSDLIPFMKGDEWFRRGFLCQLQKLRFDLERFSDRLKTFTQELSVCNDWIKQGSDPHLSDGKLEWVSMQISRIASEVQRQYKVLFSENFTPLWDRVQTWGDEALQKTMQTIDDHISSQVNPLVQEIASWARELSEEMETLQPDQARLSAEPGAGSPARHGSATSVCQKE